MVKYSERQIDSMFHSLADSTRRDIISRIIREELRVGEIASNYKMSLPAVSKHLKVLERADLVLYEKSGREKIYSANPRALLEIQKYIEFYTKFWNKHLDNVEEYLKNKHRKNK